MKKYAFIVSTGRTGTHALTTIINAQVENAWSLHEPSPSFRRRSIKLIGQPHSLWHVKYLSFSRRLRHFRRAEEWYVESNFHLYSAIPVIRAAFPGSLLIHVVRDARPVVTSWLNKNGCRYGPLRPTPFNVPGDQAQDAWHSWNPLQKNAWNWVRLNEMIALQKPDLTVKFENTFGPSTEGLFQILDTLAGTRYDRARVLSSLAVKRSPSKSEFIPQYPQWPEHWKRQFWEIAGATMSSFGYERND